MSVNLYIRRKGADVVAGRSPFIRLQRAGVIPDDIESNLRFAHFTTGLGRLPVLGTSTPRVTVSPGFFPIGDLMRMVTMYIFSCIHCHAS